MNIEDAVNQVAKQPNQETLHVVGSIEREPGDNKIRVYPDPHDMSRYVLIDPQSIAGDVLDITEQVRRTRPSQRNLVFSIPVRKGAEIQIVSVTTIPITDVAKMSRLSLNQSACCNCAREGDDAKPLKNCTIGRCITVEGEEYDCWETWKDLTLCSGCCLIAKA